MKEIVKFEKISNWLEDIIKGSYSVLLESALINPLDIKFYNQYGNFIEDEIEPEYKQDRKAPVVHCVIQDFGGSISDNPNYIQYFKSVGLSMFIPLDNIEDGERIFNDITGDYKTRVIELEDNNVELTIPNMLTKSEKVSHAGRNYIIIDLTMIFNFLADLMTSSEVSFTVDDKELYFSSFGLAYAINTQSRLRKETETTSFATNGSRILTIDCLMNKGNEALDTIMREWESGIVEPHTIKTVMGTYTVSRQYILKNVQLQGSQGSIITVSLEFTQYGE